MGHLPGTSIHLVTGKDILHEQHTGCKTGWILKIKRDSVGELAASPGFSAPSSCPLHPTRASLHPAVQMGKLRPEGAERSLRSPGRSGHTRAGTLTSGPGAQVPPSAPGGGGAQGAPGARVRPLTSARSRGCRCEARTRTPSGCPSCLRQHSAGSPTSSPAGGPRRGAPPGTAP